MERRRTGARLDMLRAILDKMSGRRKRLWARGSAASEVDGRRGLLRRGLERMKYVDQPLNDLIEDKYDSPLQTSAGGVADLQTQA